MRWLSLFFWLSIVIAFDPEDHEIFDIQDSLKSLYGDKANFYSVLGLAKDATEKAITKAYRKKSLEYHPDKNPSEEAQQFYKILTSVQATLKDPALRERYNGHLERGFPVWRGSGYYYSHFEPGLIFTFVFILATISVAQYIIQWVYYYQAKQRLEEEKPQPLTYSQRKKQLKQEGVKLKRKEFNKLSQEDEPQTYDLQTPRVLDLLLFQFPFLIVGFVRRVLSKSHEKKVE
jgi:curved DNA-binding protein CbpA